MHCYKMTCMSLQSGHVSHWIGEVVCLCTISFRDQNKIRKNCKISTWIKAANMAYSLDGDTSGLVSAIVTEKLQIQCVMTDQYVEIKPPLQILDIGNGCEAFSSTIYMWHMWYLHVLFLTFSHVHTPWCAVSGHMHPHLQCCDAMSYYDITTNTHDVMSWCHHYVIG